MMAIVPLRTASISMREVRRLTHSDAAGSRLLWQEMLGAAEAGSEWLVNLGRKTAIERIADLFCELADRIGRLAGDGSGSCEMPLTQADIADTTGLTAVHVNRTLQEMRAAGLIELHSRRLVIIDIERLRRIAHFQPYPIDRSLKAQCRALVRIAGPA
jgi:CRP-like cAMP-binding protein